MKSVEYPWIQQVLDKAKQVYSKPLPRLSFSPVTVKDRRYIIDTAAEPDAFDANGCKNAMAIAVLGDEAKIEKCVSALGTIFVVKFKDDPYEPPWATWWRCVQMVLPPTKPVRVIVFAHPIPRLLPGKGQPIGPREINGGYTTRCDAKSIVIYRKEEATRVLMHELFHASCSDPYHKETPFIEADTEAWAEILLCALVAKGDQTKWVRYFREQVHWALRQGATLRDMYGVHHPNDYAWRYAVGRLVVWRRLGLSIPDIPLRYKPVTSLRLTLVEPKE